MSGTGLRTSHLLRERSRRPRLGTAILAITVGLAGCGGHGPTRADVIARGNAICANAQSEIRAVTPPSGGSAAALAAYLGHVRPIVHREATAIAALPRPGSGGATLERFITAVGEVDRDYGRAAAAAAAGNSAGLADALSGLRDSPAEGLARAYGLRECGGSAATVS